MEELKESLRQEEEEKIALEQEAADVTGSQTEDLPEELLKSDAYELDGEDGNELDADALDEVTGGAKIAGNGTAAKGVSTKDAGIASQTQGMLTSQQLFRLRRGDQNA